MQKVTPKTTLNPHNIKSLNDKDLAKLYQIFVIWGTDPAKISAMVKAEAERRKLSDNWIRMMTRFWP